MKNKFWNLICFALVFFVVGCEKAPSIGISEDEISGDEKIMTMKEEIVKMQKTEKMQLKQLTKDIAILKKRNPFNPQAVVISPDIISTLNLTGIIWSKESPLAIINDSVVSEGGVIGKKRVNKITENSVILIEDGKEYILRLE